MITDLLDIDKALRGFGRIAIGLIVVTLVLLGSCGFNIYLLATR